MKQIGKTTTNENKRKGKINLIIATGAVAIIVVFALVFNIVISPNNKYTTAMNLLQEENYAEALSVFYELGDFKDSNAKILEIKANMYNEAVDLLNQKKYEESFLVFRKLYGYRDSNKFLEKFEVKSDSMVLVKSPNSEYKVEGESEKNIYDDNGYLIESVKTYGNGEYTEEAKYINDLQGRCLRKTSVTTSKDEEWKNVETEDYNYKGDIIKSTSDYGNGLSTTLHNYLCDENGNCIKKTTIFNGEESSYTDYTYDENGNCIKEVYTANSGDYDYVITRMYNDKGILEEETYKKTGVENISKYNEFGKLIYFEHDYVDEDESYKEESIYNEYGDCIKSVKTCNNGAVITTNYLYDEYGRVLKYGSNLKKSSGVDGEYTYEGVRITFKTESDDSGFKDIVGVCAASDCGKPSGSNVYCYNHTCKQNNCYSYASEDGYCDKHAIKKSSGSSGSFTNKYGSKTTKCYVSGCSNYIATSGDTNCCISHSNRCGECNCYIDGDALFCMSCLEKALR